MERHCNIRSLEDVVLDRISIQEFLSVLTPDEFDVLWDRTKPNFHLEEIFENNNISVSEYKTIFYTLGRKAIANLT